RSSLYVLSPSLSVCCVLASSPQPPDPHSFPTRRSSDLSDAHPEAGNAEDLAERPYDDDMFSRRPPVGWCEFSIRFIQHEIAADRSEEHTSELQSRFDLVCRLLLEKKNKSTQHTNHNMTT